jgi:AmiR/NasT family two-component response regulator
MPEVQLVAQATDANAAVDFCQGRPIELMILEVKPGDRDLLAKVPDMKVHCPQGQVIALIHDEEDWQPAEAAGVDLVMRVGIRASGLMERIGEAVYSFVEVS